MHSMLRAWRRHGEWFIKDEQSTALVLSKMEYRDLSVLERLLNSKNHRRGNSVCRKCGAAGHYAKTCGRAPKR